MGNARFFCAGAYPALQRTLFVPTFVPGAVNRSTRVRADVAGKAVNAARALLRLGGQPVLGGFSGGGSGLEIERLLREEGLDCSGFLSVDAPVRTCQTILPEDGSPFTELVEEGPEQNEATWQRLIAHCRGRLQSMDYAAVILAGTMPEHASLDFYPRLIRAARGPVILDTSRKALFAALSAKPEIVKINQDELRASCELDGVASSDLVVMAQHILSRGAGCIGVTRGARDALLVTPDEVWDVEVPSVEVVSALGSGDCVNAGMAFALERGESLVEAFAFGIACGTANAEITQPGAMDAQRAAALISQVKIRKR